MTKFLIISKSGDELGLAHRLRLEGHETVFWMKDDNGPRFQEGLTRRVKDWKSELDKDTIVVFGMVGLGKQADELRSRGYKVVGASSIADELELDRAFGLSVAENHSIPVPESESFQDFDKGIAWLNDQDEDTGSVFKPCDNKEGVRTFVATSIEQMVQMLEHAKECWTGKVDFVLQKVVDGVEISSEVWCVNGEIVPNSYNNTLEQKRFLNGDLGPNTGCYSSDTEILTESGWKRYDKLSIGECVLTLNYFTGFTEYQPIEAIHTHMWRYPMCHFANKTLDLLVTHDHNMLIGKGDSLEFIKAKKLAEANDSRLRFIRKSHWFGEEEEYFTLPEWNSSWKGNNGATSRRHKEALEIPMNDWLAFLGLYISEGSMRFRKGRPTGINIAQKVCDVEMDSIIRKMPFAVCRNKDGWQIMSGQLATYLQKFGYSYEKHIPREILMLGSRQLEILFHSMILGDGSIHKNGQRTYYTCSKQLADDVQELFQKIGSEGIIRVRNRIGQEFKATTNGTTRRLSYEVIERRKEATYCRKTTRKLVPYVGTVWCVTVPNHTVYVRRNGNAIWCGNCMGSTVKFNLCPRLFDETFKKLAPWLKAQKYTGPLDINCIIGNDGTPYMLEWTARFGYSAVYAMLECLNMPLGEFLAQIASGQIPDLQPKDEWGGALRLTMPPYPHVENAPECEGLPIIGLDLEDEHVWPLDVCKDGDKILCSGFDAIVCELSGSDIDLESMWADLYHRAKQLQVPECQFRTDNYLDVARRVDELIDLGYADSAESLSETEYA